MFAIIRALVISLLALTTTVTAIANDHFQITKLAPDILMLSTDQGSYSNNSLVFTGPDGVLLVDTHHNNDAEAFKTFVEDLGLVFRAILSVHTAMSNTSAATTFSGLSPSW